MLKQIKKEHLLFYQRNILPDLYNHFVKNKDSIICRVFGLYKIKIDLESGVKATAPTFEFPENLYLNQYKLSIFH